MASSIHNKYFWQNYDVLLHLFNFMEERDVVRFATCCRFLHQMIVDHPDYWEQQYRYKFCLGDQREQSWLTWYSWHINAAKESNKPSLNVNQTTHEDLSTYNVITADDADYELISPVDDPSSVFSFNTITTIDTDDYELILPVGDLPPVSNLDTINWFYAYRWRRHINRKLTADQFKKWICDLPIDKYSELELVEVNRWYTLVWCKQETKIWSIQYNLFNQKSTHNDEQLIERELITSLASPLFKKIVQTHSVYGVNQFIVAHISMDTYGDVNSVAIGDPIVNLAEMEAEYIKENKLEVSNNLDKSPSIASTTESAKERTSSLREAIIVWPDAGYSSPNIIYLQDKSQSWEGHGVSCLVGIYNNHVLLQTKSMQDLYKRFDFLDLVGKQWIEGPRLSSHVSCTCIQFASSGQCQLLTWTLAPSSIEYDSTYIAYTAQNLSAFSNSNRLMHVQWELFDVQKDQSQCKKILSNQITIPYCSNAIIKAETYTEGMCLISVYDGKMQERYPMHTFKALLSLFALEKSSSKDLSQSMFDARDLGQLLPIDSSDQGRIVWTRTINCTTIAKLYSEK
ncbi:hypothetical protein BDF19DRAFT_435161, partial [Syncephalis fuscata]